MSIVDAEAIILATCAEIYAFQGDADQGRYFRQKFDERIRKLAQGQSHDLTLDRRTSYRRRVAGGGRSPLGNYEPTSGAWPSVADT